MREDNDAVRLFAGPDYAVPVFEPEARLLLSRVEPIADDLFADHDILG
jgi:hypothetical protein